MNEELDRLILTAMNHPRNSRVENQIIKLLRGLDQSEALRSIQLMANNGGVGGVGLAMKVLNRPDIVESFFVFGLERCDVSTIGMVLRFAIPKLGLRRSIRVIIREQQSKPLLGEWALYWLPRIVDKKDAELLGELSAKLRS